MVWILGRLHFDLLVFVLPGFVAFALAKTIPPQAAGFAAFAFLIGPILDSGHAYATGWRVFRGEEGSRWRIRAPLLLGVVGLLVFCWVLAGAWGFWTFVLYFTLFHHVRQYHGISRWYQGLNARADAASEAWLYALTLLPALAFHFRSDVNFGIFVDGDLLRFPAPALWISTVFIWLSLFLAWITREAWLWRSGTREPNRVLSLAVPAALHAVCFFFGSTLQEVVFPLLAAHGLSYLVLIGLSLPKVEPRGSLNAVRPLATVMVATVIAAALWETWLEAWIDADTGAGPLWTAALTALLLAPTLWHYIVDGFIWKRSDPAAARMYASFVRSPPETSGAARRG